MRPKQQDSGRSVRQVLITRGYTKQRTAVDGVVERFPDYEPPAAELSAIRGLAATLAGRDRVSTGTAVNR